MTEIRTPNFQLQYLLLLYLMNLTNSQLCLNHLPITNYQKSSQFYVVDVILSWSTAINA